jgi:hypothetical protein
MIFERRVTVLHLILMSTLLWYPAAAKADSCDDAIAELNGVSHRAAAVSSEGGLCAEAKSLLAIGLEKLSLKQTAEAVCGNRIQTTCDSTCLQKSVADLRDIVATECSPQAGKQTTNGPPQCYTPPSPGSFRRSSSEMCFKARNTNTDPHCVYSFTYTLSGKGSQAGGNVAPGESEERCSLQPGVDIAFERWTQSVSSAR